MASEHHSIESGLTPARSRVTEGHSQGFATIKEANRGVKMAQNTRGAAEHGLGSIRSLRNVWFAAKGFTAHIKRMVANEHLPQLLPQ